MRSRRTMGYALGAALLVSPGVAASAPRPPACFVAAFSPAFARDRTIFCVTVSDGDGTRLHRSSDAGRTWRAGPRLTARPVNVPDLIVSPGYATDRTLWVVSGRDGMWLSRDGGNTFGAEENGPYFGALRATPYVDPTPVPRPAFVEGALTNLGTGVYDTLTGWRTVVGTPQASIHFIVPPGYGAGDDAVGIGFEGGMAVGDVVVRRDVMQAYLCRSDFTCVTPLFDFGKVHPLETKRIAPGDDFVVTFPLRDAGKPFAPASTLRAWRSRDYGRTWSRWTSMERLLIRLDDRGDGAFPAIVVTKSADVPRRLFAHTHNLNARSATQPASQVWRSDDDGRTWRRIGYSWGPKQAHAGRGTLPWNDPGHSIGQVLPWISAQPGGLLYAIGARRVGTRVTNQHLWCSRDLGRTWRTAC